MTLMSYIVDVQAASQIVKPNFWDIAKSWFVPAVVVPALMAVLVAARATYISFY